MAGIAALLNQSKGGPQGNLNPQLYQMAARVPGAFHDVSVASSGVTGCIITTPSMCDNSLPSPVSLAGGQPGFMVTTGYDEVTGLGSLDTQVFIDNYLSASQTTPTVTVSGTAVTVLPGATSGNTSTVTVTPANNFTGSVTVTATITSSPNGAVYLPTLSFGNTTSVMITGAAAQTATLTVTTTAATSSAVQYPMHRRLPWQGARTLACLLLFSIPTRHRKRVTKLGMLGFVLLLTSAMLACGGGSGGGGGGGGGTTSIPGTTGGTYVVTVSCTSGLAILSTGTLTLHVQ